MISIAPTPPDVDFANSKCGRCTAICCNYFALEIDAPDEPEDFENLRWYILHEDTHIFVDDGDWFLQIFRKCVWLDGNKCGRYEDRPNICREYTNDECDFDGPQSDELFTTIEELEAYRDKWVADYERKRRERRERKNKAARSKRTKRALKSKGRTKRARRKDAEKAARS